MKIFLIIVFVVLAAVFLIITYLYFAMSGYVFDPGESNKIDYVANTINKETFIKTDYVELGTNTVPDQFTVVDVSAQYGSTTETYFEPVTKNIIIFTYVTDSDLSRNNVIVNSRGGIVGVISSEEKLFPLSNFLLGHDGHYSFSSSSVSEFIQYSDANYETADTDAVDKLHQQSIFYRSFSYSDFPFESPEYNNKIHRHVFYFDNQWQKIDVTGPENPGKYLQWKYPEFKKLQVQYNLRDSENGYKDNFTSDYSVQLDYFEKQQYSQKRNPAFMSSTGQGSPAYWTGIGYYSLKKDNNILRFKIDNDRFYTERSQSGLMTVNGHPEIDFVILESPIGHTVFLQKYLITNNI